MKNKYYLSNKREERMTKINTFLVEKSLSLTLAIPKMVFKLVIRVFRKVISKRKNLSYGFKPVYNYLDVPDECFKSNKNSIVRF